ncbi:uncharacterized protein FIESC28_04928 [Fusarium coffeatum]|uniref:FAR1 domain-containing protein n=1 Tax=Fusarium coffeatum TaxID=231269 RepID=A0A366RWE8_9HYPO|nr:uncharacterized protein FIESC28_04928 [Fusarium coffeatum]RBR21391.1 hypothetical protein FIESC28_04928 [Fusarium coffeatum]
MFGILEAVTVPHSGIFNSYEELFKELSDRMEKEGYKIVKARSHRGKVGGADIPGNDIVRCDLVCDRGGRPYRCMATKHKTTTKKTDCPWKAKAVHRKTMGGWVLTITCDQHNHEPGTPEPPTPEPESEDGNNIVEDLEADQSLDADGTPLLTWGDDAPQPDVETSAAIRVAGVSEAVLRLTGDTFHQFKSEYRKMAHPDRVSILSNLQLRIAAIYAVQNEDLQRQKRQEAQDKRHRQIEETKRQNSVKQRARQRRQQVEQNQQNQQQQMHHIQQQPLPQTPQVQPQVQPQAQSQAQSQAQAQAHAQAQAQAQAQNQMMLQSQLYLPQNSQPTPIPVPNMDMPQFQHYVGPPKRMRGRPSQGG